MAQRPAQVGQAERQPIGWQAKLAAVGAAAFALTLPWHNAAAADGPNLLALGIGGFDIVRFNEPAADVRLEYRHGQGIWIFKPWLGLEATSAGTVYGVGGILSDFALGRRIVVTPSIGIGAWYRGGGLDLGSVVEFRSQLELAYRFDDEQRLGVAFSHISNAGIGNHNTGVEIATLYYSMPIAFDRLRP
jgi:lipid A 3-O-deacylase